MKSDDKKYGIVAILDALGVANYTDKEIERFLESRSIVMKFLREKSERAAKRLDVNKVTTFTFNDTVLIILESASINPSSNEITAFLEILRKFLVDSLENGIIFRGAFAVGDFYRDDDTNTILGKAVTDAATWYNKADWVGIISTPKTSMYIDYLREKHNQSLKHLVLNYEVPMSDGKVKNLKTVNWPKVFWVKGITPCKLGESKREALLRLLGKYTMPTGTDQKHYHAREYFEYVMKKQNLENGQTKTST